MMGRRGEIDRDDGDDVRLHAVLDTLVDPVFIMAAQRDASGALVDLTYRFVNAAGLRLSGRSPEELLGHGELELFPSRRARGVVDRYERVLAGGEPERYEISWSESDGFAGAFDTSVAKFRDGLLVSCRVITEQKRVEGALASASRSLRTFVATSEALVHARDETGLFDDVCRVLVEEGGYRFAWVGVPAAQDPSGVVALAYHGEVGREYFDLIHATSSGLVEGVGPVIEALRSRQVQLVGDVEALPRAGPWRSIALDHGVRSAVALPLIVGDSVSGALGIFSAQAGAFDPDTVQLFQEFAAELEYGIATLQDRTRNQKNLEQLAATLEAAVGAVAASTEFDPYTAGHQRGVAKIAVTIANELGLDADTTKGIEVAAMLHDIGKIVVPAQILSKPAKLSVAEFELVKVHPQAGVDIIAGIDFPWPVAETILQHHERLDGSGYPSGLKGDEICLGARVVMVADVLEAMTSPRPYRPAASVAEALAEIDKQGGTQFDPEVTAVCLRLYSGMKRRRFDGDPGYWYPTATAVSF
ncbi:MAG TPA: HD domain-containing phosphohydrolase [Acidimicrobiales bacterium]|nr:HD domain-containing phosphohydrolase [Acidimicrobiales bacterium]